MSAAIDDSYSYAPMTAAAIIQQDRVWKESISPGFDADASKLYQLFHGQSRTMMVEYLQQVQLGDKKNPRPPTPNLCRRLVEQLAVCYRTPPTRLLQNSAEQILAHDDPAMRALVSRRDGVYRLMRFDTAMARADQIRSLNRQSVVVYCENQEQRRVNVRVHPPHCVFRVPDPNAADSIDADRAFAFLRTYHYDAKLAVYEVWNRTPDGWLVTVENGDGDLVGEAPYAESGGLVPFAELPVQILYDEDPVGQAWLPQDQSRLDALYNVGAMLADMVYLLAMECFTIKAAFGVDPNKPATEVGPNKILNLPKGADLKILSHNPQIDKASTVIQEVLAALALSEGLAPNAFARDRTELTGATLRASNALLEQRRSRQIALAVDFEAAAYRKIAAVHNTYAQAWDRPELDPSLELVAIFPEPSIPTDAVQAQQVRFKDLQAGFLSPLEYIQAQRGVTREDAIEIAEQIRADRAEFGMSEALQNPGAMVDGPNAASGPGSAEKTPGATNLDGSSNNEQASVTGAVVRAMGSPASAHQQGPAEPKGPVAAAGTADKAQDTALNGAQVTAALDIVAKVAARELPRATGIGMLKMFFNLDDASAEQAMGPVGASFFAAPTTPGDTTPSGTVDLAKWPGRP